MLNITDSQEAPSYIRIRRTVNLTKIFRIVQVLGLLLMVVGSLGSIYLIAIPFVSVEQYHILSKINFSSIFIGAFMFLPATSAVSTLKNRLRVDRAISFDEEANRMYGIHLGTFEVDKLTQKDNHIFSPSSLKEHDEVFGSILINRHQDEKIVTLVRLAGQYRLNITPLVP